MRQKKKRYLIGHSFIMFISSCIKYVLSFSNALPHQLQVNMKHFLLPFKVHVCVYIYSRIYYLLLPNIHLKELEIIHGTKP